MRYYVVLAFLGYTVLALSSSALLLIFGPGVESWLQRIICVFCGMMGFSCSLMMMEFFLVTLEKKEGWQKQLLRILPAFTTGMCVAVICSILDERPVPEEYRYISVVTLIVFSIMIALGIAATLCLISLVRVEKKKQT